MLIRSCAVAIATALLLAGCQTFTTNGFLPPDKRDQTPYSCSADPECYVRVDPSSLQWVPEYIIVDRGKKLDLWINNAGEFADPPITMKQGVPAILDCPEKNKLIVKCKVSSEADPNTKYGYTINVKDRPPYDPFVWPR